MDHVICKKRRFSKGPQKKWSHAETETILNYLRDTVASNLEIEKPTANIYYAKLIQTADLKCVTPILIKNKVRNLKQQFIRANEFRNKNMNILDDARIKEYMYRICPYWELMDEIFGSKINLDDSTCDSKSFINDTVIYLPSHENVEDHEDSSEQDMSVYNMLPVEEPSSDLNEMTDSLRVINPERLNLVNIEHAKGTYAPKSFRKRKHNSVSSGIYAHKFKMESLKLKMNLEERRLKLEQQWQKEKLEIERERLEIETEKINLEREKIASNEKIKIIQIEKDERVARYEIEMKYRMSLKPKNDTGTPNNES